MHAELAPGTARRLLSVSEGWFVTEEAATKKWLVVVLMIVLGVVTPVAAQDPPKPDGTWAIKVDFEQGSMYLSYLQNFNADGRTTFILPWVSASLPDNRVGCMGEWKVRPGRDAKDYDFTIRCLYDQAWDSTFGEIRGILVMDRGGDKWTADFTYYDWTGGAPGWGGQGVMYADRIGIKPLK